MRTIWNGPISFGLVNIPIGLALATQRNDVAFRTLHRECGTPIKQKRWCPFHEREVEPEELVKGWEVAKGEFVLVEESDLESVALQRSQSIEILRFVELAEVDPVYFDRTYYLAPAAADAQRRPYVLLLRAMQESGMAAVGKFVLWGKENLCLIRAQGDERLQLRLEEVLVDLAVVDRHALLHTHPDHLLLVDPQLLRKLLGREVIRHAFRSFRGYEKTRRRRALRRVRPFPRLSCRQASPRLSFPSIHHSQNMPSP